MATRARLEDPLPEGDPALLHGDPDLRPGQLDGLIVDGQDPFAARRRQMREMHDGPDPTSPAAPVRRDVPGTGPREETPMALNTVPLSQIPADPSRDAKAPRPTPPGTVRLLSPAEWDALPGGRYGRTPALQPAVEALAQGKCVSVSVEPKRVPATRQALRKLAKERGLTLEIRSGRDYVAARAVPPIKQLSSSTE